MACLDAGCLGGVDSCLGWLVLMRVGLSRLVLVLMLESRRVMMARLVDSLEQLVSA